MPFFGFEVGRFDRGAMGQVDHAVGWRPFVLAVKELGAFQQKVATAPVLNDCGVEGEEKSDE